MSTHTFSPFGCPGDLFINRNDLNLKILIDPPSSYFNGDLKRDRLNYDKLILIQGMEPKDIIYISEEVIKNHEYFDVILTSYQDVLDSCKNAKHFLYASCWILTDKNESSISLKKDYYNIFDTEKKFMLSHVMSHKNWLPGHNLRHKTAEMVRKPRNFELLFPESISMGHKYRLFKDSMFHITIENSQNHNYISEKVVDCFMSYTIPIYWGCPNIMDYFDKDGIISFETEEELENILDNLTEEDYIKRKNAVVNNYQIAFEKYGFWYDRVNEIIKTL
jgi:hypothetical protein